VPFDKPGWKVLAANDPSMMQKYYLKLVKTTLVLSRVEATRLA